MTPNELLRWRLQQAFLQLSSFGPSHFTTMEIKLPPRMRFRTETAESGLLLRIFADVDRPYSGVRSDALREAHAGDFTIKFTPGTHILPEIDDNGTILRILQSQDSPMTGPGSGFLSRPGVIPAQSPPAQKVSWLQQSNPAVADSVPAQETRNSTQPKWAIHLTNCPLNL